MHKEHMKEQFALHCKMLNVTFRTLVDNSDSSGMIADIDTIKPPYDRECFFQAIQFLHEQSTLINGFGECVEVLSYIEDDSLFNGIKPVSVRVHYPACIEDLEFY